MLRVSAFFFALAIGCSAFAQSDPLGKWVGKIHVQDAKGKMAPMPGLAGEVSYVLEIKKDGSYSTVINGTPDKVKHTADGTWKRAGTKTTLTVQKRDGKPDQSEPKTRILTISSDGKTLRTPMEGQVQVRGPNGETTPPKGFVPPKVFLVFTRTK